MARAADEQRASLIRERRTLTLAIARLPMSSMNPEAVIVSADVPAQADVVIVGGGIIGVSTAYFLAERGISVALCEKGLIGAEQSSRNWGWVRQMGRDPAELPLAISSLDLWRGLDERIQDTTGFRQTGISYLCETGDEMGAHEASLEHARAHGIDTRLLGSRELTSLLPGIGGRFRGGLYTPGDGRAEPARATPAIARAAGRLGAHLVGNCA